MNNKNKDMTWLKLDNAALIYPATINRKIATMFRFTVTLIDEVDMELLQKALDNIMKRFPTFNYALKEGFFWFYLDLIKDSPKIGQDYQNPLVRINWKDNKNYMFRVRVHHNRIAVEYFHALTDGTGGLTFILTLVGEYLKLKYNINYKYNNLVLNPNDEVLDEEIEDSFLRYAKKSGKMDKEKKAYHIKGIEENANIINIITGKVSISKLKKICTKYNATITEFLTSLILESLEEISKKEINCNRPVKVSVPVNLRKIFNSSTMRNFSSYVNVGIIVDKNGHSFEEIIFEVKRQIKEMTTKKKMTEKISANVNLAKNLLIRIIPLFIKKRIMSLVENRVGDGYVTTTLSNIGLVKLPKEMEQYITDINFILGKSKGKSGSISAVGYQDTLYITFSRKIKEAELERLFFTKLVKMGLEVEIESNR